MDRKKFVKKTGTATGLMAVSPVVIKDYVSRKPSDSLNVAVIGISGILT